MVYAGGVGIWSRVDLPYRSLISGSSLARYRCIRRELGKPSQEGPMIYDHADVTENARRTSGDEGVSAERMRNVSLQSSAKGEMSKRL